MRRALVPAILCAAAVSGCANGRQGLVQALRVPSQSVPVTHTPAPPADPHALTPLEQKIFDEGRAKAKGPKEPPPGVLPHGRVASAVSRPEIRWRQDYESTQRRPIETLRVGSGDRRVFVTSSLHGNEADTVRIVEGAIVALSNDSSRLSDRTLLAVRSPNPDGASDRTLTNSRGVDLNRNWPSPRFPASAERITGEAPASEPETRALIQILADFHPNRVIHIVYGSSLRGEIVATCDVKAIPGFDVVRTDELKAATLEDYSATRLKAEVVTLILPLSQGAANDPEAVRQLVALITDQAPAAAATAKAAQQASPSDRSEPARLDGNVTAVPAAKSSPDGTKGYVQLLPEPPNPTARTLQTNDAGGLNIINGSRSQDSRYFELPPPM